MRTRLNKVKEGCWLFSSSIILIDRLNGLFTDTAADNKLLFTTRERETDKQSLPKPTPSSPNEPMTSPIGYSADMMTSLRSSAEALLWLQLAKTAPVHSTCATELLPPPIRDLSMLLMNPTPTFPVSADLLSPTVLGHRRALNVSSFTQTHKELLNIAALSMVQQQPLLSRLPWQQPFPLCCLLQPEVVGRRCCAIAAHFPLSAGDMEPLQPRQRVNSSRRAVPTPVNWLLSDHDDVKVTSCDDVRVKSSARREDHVWNSTTVSASGAARQRSRDADRRRTTPNPRSPTPPANTSGVGVAANVMAATERKLTCRHCGKLYASLGALKMHIRTHTLPCRCQLCGKAFSRPWLLQGHLRTHTGERPFACPQCGRAFADRSNLRAHLQTHAELKKYACDRCTKTFSRLSLLVKHRNGSAVCGAASSSSWRP